MSDIFISYAREDRAQAQRLAQALQQRGWAVWWDREILPGQTFDREIERALDAARAVVVLWSPHAVASDWVRNEAGAAQDRGVLVPALIAGNTIPLAFRRNQAAQLAGWKGEDAHDGWQALCRGITRLLGDGQAAGAMPAERVSKPGPSAPATCGNPTARTGVDAQTSASANAANATDAATGSSAPRSAVSRRPLLAGAGVLALLVVAWLVWPSANGPSHGVGSASSPAKPDPVHAAAARAASSVQTAAEIALASGDAASNPPAAAAVDLANRVAGRYAGDIIADSQGPSRQGVVLTIDRIDARTVRITSSDQPRLDMAALRVSMADAQTVLGESSDTPFIAKLSAGGVSLIYAPRNQLSFNGSRQPP